MWIHYNWLKAGEQRSSKLSSIIFKYFKIKSLLETKPNYVNDMQDLHNIQDVQGPSDSRANHRMPHRYLRALGCRRDSAPSAAWKNGSIIEIWAESAENVLWRQQIGDLKWALANLFWSHRSHLWYLCLCAETMEIIRARGWQKAALPTSVRASNPARHPQPWLCRHWRGIWHSVVYQ